MRSPIMTLIAPAAAAVLLSGCVSAAIPEAGVVNDLIVGRIQGAVNDYCKKPEGLRLAYRAIAAEAIYPHAFKIACAKASIVDPAS